MTLDSYLQFWGWAYLLATLGLALLKREDRTRDKGEGVWGVYKVMGGILRLRNIQIFILIHLIAKIGFQANDAVTNLKLLDKGFSQEDLALTVLIDFPFEISLGYYAGKWSEQYRPVTVWCWAFMGRLAAAIFAQAVVMAFPTGGTTGWYLLVVIVEHVFSTFMSTVMFVAISAFHAKIADPVIGGTYMTLLATYVYPFFAPVSSGSVLGLLLLTATQSEQPRRHLPALLRLEVRRHVLGRDVHTTGQTARGSQGNPHHAALLLRAGSGEASMSCWRRGMRCTKGR